MRVVRLWHTLRWLHPVQFYGRLWFRLARPKPDQRATPTMRVPVTEWAGCRRAPSMTGAQRFRFLGVERELATPHDWNRADWSKLWLYNAHYFDDLAADAAVSRIEWHRALMDRWIEENPAPVGNGWEPYPTSLRIVNWTKWALAGNPMAARTAHSLAVQVRQLRRRLEIHLLGNHLWANAKALVFAGAFFECTEADAWRSKGLDLLTREIEEQILADGGHFERSPMYQCILLEDILDLIQLAKVYPRLFDDGTILRWRDAAARMLRWLRIMTHPDGGISFFNDAALAIAPGWAALNDYAQALGLESDQGQLKPLEILAESGYVRMQAGAAVLIADVGPVGPDYLPGHAHADTLSFELSLHGQRVLVNGGTSTYEGNVLRLQQRGTAMHNTVEVDGQDSSEVWGTFRVARRARPRNVTWHDNNGALELSASHDGYMRLPGRVMHARSWHLGDGWLKVTDSLSGQYTTARAMFRFSPTFERALDSKQMLASETLRVHWQAHGAAGSVTSSTWYPRFGEEQPCALLEVALAEQKTMTEFSWA